MNREIDQRITSRWRRFGQYYSHFLKDSKIPETQVNFHSKLLCLLYVFKGNQQLSADSPQ